MEELKLSEQRATVEDLMYASVLERFVELGVPMLPRVESIVESPGDLKALTEGVHSREARSRPIPSSACCACACGGSQVAWRPLGPY